MSLTRTAASHRSLVSPATRPATAAPTRAELLARVIPLGLTGSVTRLSGLALSVAGFPAPLGAWCRVERQGAAPLRGEVVGFHDQEAVLLCEGDLAGVRPGSRVVLERSTPTLRVGPALLGRVLDGSGRLLDQGPAPVLHDRVSFQPENTSPLDRPRIETPLVTGIRALDGFLTCGLGQRLGIFAGSGVGKSVLLGQISRHSSADVNIVVLIGERGREVREFLDDNLGPEGLARSVVVAATSDESPLVRRRAASVGAALAEYFRDRGQNVLLVVDSITRLALAQREIGLAAGEPPATRGFPPSVFALLPRVLERSGRSAKGSITGLYTVLVEGDDPQEPIADTVRGILDGHVMLSRRLAERGHFPAIDLLASLSRVMGDVVSREHQGSAAQIRRILAAYAQAEDLVSIGAYQAGSRREVDVALAEQTNIQRFLCQDRDDWTDWPTLQRELATLAQRLEAGSSRS
ncbi:MAG TPA: EscN/YscN/HrcN family type III secretion system ATPase [Planctomycetaceae bacterium]|nr:EscN/YscN/HrcN family type III secretion system ATPase [Planctomycetaceae bacterium]